MKQRANIRQLFILTGFAILLAACGQIAPPDQNGNLPAKQNTNAFSPSPIPSAIPTIAVEETPPITPSPMNNSNVSNNANLPILPVNGNIDSANNNSSPGIVDKLIIPVAGIKPESLVDTFKDARSEGRVHDAIDIMSPGGAQVLAAADGEIARFFDSEKGGITIYQFSRDKKLIYYYAHLQRRADEIQEHQFVKQGTVIGYVGDTGNAGAGNFHLHFAIWIINDPKHYWDGTNINPYPLLR